MIPEDERREAIIAVLDAEDAWSHVILNYIGHMRHSRYLVYRKDGQLNRSYNIGRVLSKLAVVMGIEIKQEDRKE
jgi:hypothetical protein